VVSPLFALHSYAIHGKNVQIEETVTSRVGAYGVKPRQLVAPLYEDYWLYAAVEPTTGDAFWWELPRLDAECFTIFLHQFGQQYPESLNIVFLDQAPAHVAQRVVVPDNIVLVWLPPYSPELNPVERLWEDLKYRIDVQNPSLRTNLPVFREHIASIIRGYTAEAITSLTGYSYLVEAAYAL
jgi:putative transposase